ncbi:MAG: PEP-CTERM sorting domain-containing protein [Roseiarcus sp.]
MLHIKARLLIGVAAFALAAQASVGPSRADDPFTFTTGDLVVSVEGNGVEGAPGGPYTDNQAAPLSLFEFAPDGTSAPATYVGALVLPQTAQGANSPVSGEYGSSSEGALQLSGNGKYLTIMGYGVNAAAFNADPAKYSSTGNPALGQSGSLTGQSYTAVPRVVAVIGQNGSVNSTTALYNIFDQNNPRSVYSVNGTSFYVSGQGDFPDATGGVFYATLGSHSATSITGADAGGGDSQDTRTVMVYDGQLYVSTDSKKGSTNRSFIGTLGSKGSLPTTEANGGNGPTMLSGYGNTGGTGKYTMTAANGNGLNTGLQINLSPSGYFFANADTLYVADTGNGKQTSATSAVGDGGLQKWTFNGTTWTLDYTLADGLDLVKNNTADPANTAGTTGLYGLTGEDVTIDGVEEVELFATNATIGDLDPTYLYGITDVLGDTTNPGNEVFTELAAAPADSNFKGVAFAPSPVPEASTWVMMLAGFAGLGLAGRRRFLATIRAAS